MIRGDDMIAKFFKKLGLIFIGTIATIYLLFLILPLIVSPILNNYIPKLNDEIKKATGLNSQIEDFMASVYDQIGVKEKQTVLTAAI